MAKVVPNGAAIAQLLRSPQGAVTRHIIVKATEVQEATVAQVQADTGLHLFNVVKRFVGSGQGTGVAVGARSTRPHEIVPKNASVLHFTIGGIEIFTMHVDHPGTPVTNWLLKAFHGVFHR